MGTVQSESRQRSATGYTEEAPFRTPSKLNLSVAQGGSVVNRDRSSSEQMHLPLFVIVQSEQGGFAPLSDDVLYMPNQFYDLVLPNCTLTCSRLIGLMMVHTLCYQGKDGTPSSWCLEGTHPQIARWLNCTDRSVRNALSEALDKRLIECVREPQASYKGSAGWPGKWRLRLSNAYCSDLAAFDGFYSLNKYRTPTPPKFYSDILMKESLPNLVKYVGCVIRWTVGYELDDGSHRRRLSRIMGVDTMRKVSGISNKTHFLKARELASEKRLVGYEKNDTSAVYGLVWTSSWDGTRMTDQGKDGTLLHTSYPGKNGTPSDEPGNGWYPGQGNDVTHSPEEMVPTPFENAHGNDGTPRNIPEGEKQNFGNQQTETEEVSAVATSLRSFGIDQAGVKHLMSNYDPEVVRRQIEYHPYWLKQIRNLKNPAGLLRRHIEDDSSPPENYETEKGRGERDRQAAEKNAQWQIYECHREEWGVYVLEEYERLSTQDPRRHQEFLDWEDEQWREMTKSAGDGALREQILSTLRTLFSRQDKRIQRIVEFYGEKILDLGGWAGRYVAETEKYAGEALLTGT